MLQFFDLMAGSGHTWGSFLAVDFCKESAIENLKMFESKHLYVHWKFYSIDLTCDSGYRVPAVSPALIRVPLG